MQPQSKPKRPVGIIVIAVIAAAGGLLSLFGAASVFSGNATGPTWLAIVVVVFGILEILYGGTVGGMGGAIRIVAGIIVPLYLTRPSPKNFFGKRNNRPE